jgi:hypothetical protein
VEQVNVEMDSLYNASGSTFAFPRDLNLNDMFFKYGFRINGHCQRRTRKPYSWRRVSREAPHSTRSSIGSLPHWSIRRVAPDSEKSRNQI